MLAIDWANVGYAGTFVFGMLVGMVLVIRLAKVLTETFRDLGERYSKESSDETMGSGGAGRAVRVRHDGGRRWRLHASHDDHDAAVVHDHDHGAADHHHHDGAADHHVDDDRSDDELLDELDIANDDIDHHHKRRRVYDDVRRRFYDDDEPEHDQHHDDEHEHDEHHDDDRPA